MNFPKVTIIYASTSGNVETVCFHISNTLKSKGIDTELHRAEKIGIDVIVNNSFFIFATSTWEHGEINPFFNKLLGEISHTDLSNKRSAFVGLGDTRYEQVLFCKGIDILREAFLKSGGTEVLTTLKINGEPYKYLQTTVGTWTDRLIQEISNT